MILLIVFALSMAVTVAVVFFATAPSQARKSAQTRLNALVKKSSPDDEMSIELAARSKPRFTDRITAAIENYKFGESIERLIVHSGANTTTGQIVLASAGSGVVCAFLGDRFTGMPLFALGIGAVSWLIPVGVLMFLKKRRLGKFNEALPDAIDLMARALRAGHSVSSSIEVISLQSAEPLASEFAACFQQQKFGIPFRDAALAMGERIPSDDLQFFITAVLVQKETGGDLTDILDRTAKLIRDRVRIQGEIRTYTAQGRLTGWILGLLPIVMLVILDVITPGYSDALFKTSLGQKLVTAGVVLMVIGGLIIRKIVDIKV
jgi:tight adherence protein B